MDIHIPEEIEGDVKFALKDMLYSMRVRISNPNKFVEQHGYTEFAVTENRISLLEDLIKSF